MNLLSDLFGQNFFTNTSSRLLWVSLVWKCKLCKNNQKMRETIFNSFLLTLICDCKTRYIQWAGHPRTSSITITYKNKNNCCVVCNSRQTFFGYYIIRTTVAEGRSITKCEEKAISPAPLIFSKYLCLDTYFLA